jgi:hypothetical protein
MPAGRGSFADRNQAPIWISFCLIHVHCTSFGVRQTVGAVTDLQIENKLLQQPAFSRRSPTQPDEYFHYCQ